VTVRPATAADVPAVARLESDNLGADAWSEALVAEGVSGRLPTVRYLVAEADGEVVGHAAASIVGDIAELQRIAVDPPHRRTSLASALLDAVVEAARAEALAFYAARGFVEVDRRRRYYRDGATAVVLRRGLGPTCG
jgi:ribosomal-protein-alanine N-acetyltransferase